MNAIRIAIVGERDAAKLSHQGIEASLALFQREYAGKVAHAWIGTTSVEAGEAGGIFREFDGLWCGPGGPYASTAGALIAIRHFRTAKRTFLGTCNGFQHALMEFSANVLGQEAAHAELDPAAANPLIVKLSCPLVDGATGRIIATDPERFAGILGGPESLEAFHCSYGVNESLSAIFAGSDMEFVGRDEGGEIRAFRLRGHPFFIGTLFQPERKALTGALHPIVRAFLRSCAEGRRA